MPPFTQTQGKSFHNFTNWKKNKNNKNIKYKIKQKKEYKKKKTKFSLFFFKFCLVTKKNERKKKFWEHHRSPFHLNPTPIKSKSKKLI